MISEIDVLILLRKILMLLLADFDYGHGNILLYGIPYHNHIQRNFLMTKVKVLVLKQPNFQGP